MEPQLALSQRPPAMDNERNRDIAFTESAWWRAGHLHVLGSRELGQGEKGNDGAIRGPGREKLTRVRARSGTGTCAKPIEPRAGRRAAGPGTATTAAGSDWASPAGTERNLPNGHGGVVRWESKAFFFFLSHITLSISFLCLGSYPLPDDRNTLRAILLFPFSFPLFERCISNLLILPPCSRHALSPDSIPSFLSCQPFFLRCPPTLNLDRKQVSCDVTALVKR